MPPKYRDIQKLIEKDGWMFKRQKGSHRHFVHPVKQGTLTLAGHPSTEPPEGTYKAILKQAGLKK
jgi:predicted RNA binding protein YcfA (HicA-like mRNA interferase family)